MRKRPAYLIPVGGRKGPSLLDWTAVEDEIKRQNKPTREDGFIAVVLNHLFDLSDPGTRHWIADGGNDRGIDAIIVDDTRKRVHFINTKCVKSYEKSSHNFPSSEADKSVGFLDELIYKTISPRDCNPILLAAIRAVWECFAKDHHTLHLHICSNQSPLAPNEFDRLRLSLLAKKITLEEHPIHAFVEEKPRTLLPVNRRLDFESSNIERSLKKVRTITGFVSVAEIARFLTDAGGSLDKSLFHGNIRAFLGESSPINRDIARSLYGHDRFLFECMNNGLKLICDGFLTAGGAHPVHITNPQVINGLQTGHVIFEYNRSEPHKAKDASVLVQIIETSDMALVSKIALATNSQQRIGNRDLRANDPLQIKLERELKKKGYRYLRKQGASSDTPANQTIDSLRLGQIILAYLLESPTKAKTSNAIFGDLYDDVFNPARISSEIVIALHALYRLVEGKKQLAKFAQRKLSRAEYSEEWIIEGIFHALYATKLLCAGSGGDPLKFDEAKNYVDDALEVISESFHRANTSAYRYFRLVATRSAIEAAVSERLMLNAARSGAHFDEVQGDLFNS